MSISTQRRLSEMGIDFDVSRDPRSVTVADFERALKPLRGTVRNIAR